MSRTASVSIGREDAVTADGHKLRINYEHGAVSGAFIYSKSSRQVGNPIPSSCSTEPPSGSCQLPDEDVDQLFTMQQDPDPAPRALQTAEAAQRFVAGAGLGESLLGEECKLVSCSSGRSAHTHRPACPVLERTARTVLSPVGYTLPLHSIVDRNSPSGPYSTYSYSYSVHFCCSPCFGAK